MNDTKTVSPHSAHDAYLQRVLVITSASLSITSGITVLTWWYVFPIIYNLRHQKKKRRIRQFRYDLTLALISIDLFKAIILITYPIRFLNDYQLSSAEIYVTFCDVVGFLTVATMQASDFAILALAIHTALLVFRPNFTGGLYRFRYYIYIFFFVLIPLVCASLGMVKNSGYTFFASWCYLVVRPLWYGLVLSWIPRLFIMLSIITIYLSIFIYVKVHMYNLSKAILQATQIQNSDKAHIPSAEPYAKQNVTFLGSLQHVFRISRRASHKLWRNMRIFFSFLPGLSKMNPLLDEKRQPSTSSTLVDSSHHSAILLNTESNARASTIAEEFQAQINYDNIERFNHRRNIIERQINSIFIYPLAYVLLYIFPLVQQCLYFKDDVQEKLAAEPVFWLALVASWMKPFNCCVNTLVFVIREGAIPCLAPHRRSKKLHAFSDDQNDRPDFAQGLTDEDQYYSGADVEIDYVIKNQATTTSALTTDNFWKRLKNFLTRSNSDNSTLTETNNVFTQPENFQVPPPPTVPGQVRANNNVNHRAKMSLDWGLLTRLQTEPKSATSIPVCKLPIDKVDLMETISTSELSIQPDSRRNDQRKTANNNDNHKRNDKSNDDDDYSKEMGLKEFLATLG